MKDFTESLRVETPNVSSKDNAFGRKIAIAGLLSFQVLFWAGVVMLFDKLA